MKKTLAFLIASILIGSAAIAQTEVKPDPQIPANTPKLVGHPLTSVVVTQCNLIITVYLTMKDGRLLRFDKTSNLPVNELMTIAYSADHSERVEVSCNEIGAVGYEKRDPV